ncbi:MAG TPA: hypothetical protein VNL39_00460 [Xanthobacteraceae bacterium]|nr:hypothetical protein [Xanthobacteraceae bacterium]
MYGVNKRRQPIRPPAILLVITLSFALSGCASSFSSLIDSLPREIGLPADAPERPATPAAYPAVHDMPPPRPNTTLSAEEQVELEKELTAVRARQEAITGVKTPSRRTPRQTSPVIPASASANND